MSNDTKQNNDTQQQVQRAKRIIAGRRAIAAKRRKGPRELVTLIALCLCLVGIPLAIGYSWLQGTDEYAAQVAAMRAPVVDDSYVVPNRFDSDWSKGQFAPLEVLGAVSARTSDCPGMQWREHLRKHGHFQIYCGGEVRDTFTVNVAPH